MSSYTPILPSLVWSIISGMEDEGTIMVHRILIFYQSSVSTLILSPAIIAHHHSEGKYLIKPTAPCEPNTPQFVLTILPGARYE